MIGASTIEPRPLVISIMLERYADMVPVTGSHRWFSRVMMLDL